MFSCSHSRICESLCGSLSPPSFLFSLFFLFLIVHSPVLLLMVGIMVSLIPPLSLFLCAAYLLKILLLVFGLMVSLLLPSIVVTMCGLFTDFVVAARFALLFTLRANFLFVAAAVFILFYRPIPLSTTFFFSLFLFFSLSCRISLLTFNSCLLFSFLLSQFVNLSPNISWVF